MLNQFYNYLSDKIISFFKDNPLNAGAKYNIQFEKADEVKDLYKTLKNNTLCEEFQYKDNNNEVKYTSYQLNFGNVQLIVASTIDADTNKKIQPDFLTRLRNMVGVEKGYESKAILFIHDTTLDSIMGGTESFVKEGMPFHINSIQNDILSKMVTNNFSEVDKEIIKMDLDRKRKDLIGDSVSIFEYKDLLAIIDQPCIEKEEYKNFGLFYDSTLKECSGKKLKDRLSDNAYNFSRVDDIHNYGNPETQLDKYYDDKGVDELKKEDWKSVDFKDVKKFIEDKKNTKPLEFLKGTVDWDREEGTSKVKSRIRNMIIFNKERKDELEVEFSFDSYVSKDNLRGFGDVESSTSGKKIIAKLFRCSDDANFYRIMYKNEHNIKFEFRIAVVCFSEKYFESIKTKFSIVYAKKNSFIRINTNDNSVIFNEFEDHEENYELDNNYEVIDIAEDSKMTVNIGENFEYENDDAEIKFKVNINNCIVPFEIEGTSEKIGPIEGIGVWKLKREKKCDFKLIGDNKLQFGTKEKFTRDEFRKNLSLEKEIIKNEGIYFIDNGEGLESVELDLDDDIKESYCNILRYFNENKKLPSLTYINDELKELYEKFIAIYKNKLLSIREEETLTNKEKDLFKIGMIKRNIEDREILLTPLHPLNIAYQLHLNNEISDEEMEEDILKKFNSTYLVPYINLGGEEFYIPVEQNHSPEWKYYVDEKLPRYKSSRDFVSKLVYEKIVEFVDHFQYLFNIGNNAPIKINLINTGDSKEILQGIFKYYITELKDSKTNNILPMDIYIYSDKSITNAFEEVAFNDNIKDLKESYGLNLTVGSMSEEDVLDLYREKVHFYSKKLDDGIEYAHITFVEMNNEVTKNTAKMDEIPSGIILNGLISGVPSVFTGDYYKTGFGTKFANTQNDLVTIASLLNAVNAASNGDVYHSNISKAISVPNNNRAKLDNIYNSSHWVTFIDPKVDLNFFKNDPDAKDLLIIHYSDQYTTAGGYDAITVTRKSGPYQKVIEDFLCKKGVEDVREHSAGVINMFNAINGDWLLKLISSKSNSPKEKLSILSAVKLVIAKLKKDDFIWVPVSLEEVLRVSGGAGLKQSEGFLSAKKLGFDGSASDDLLLVGIQQAQGKTLVHYYPIEVKIGYKNNDEITKAVEQAKATKKIFKEILTPKEGMPLTSTQKVYRNFLMQLVITSAEKLNLYNVCNEENWSSIIDTDLRRVLLNEEYIISDGTNDDLGEACVITFKAGNSDEADSVRKEDNIMVMEMSENEGFNFVTKSVEEIRNIVDVLDYSSNDNGEYVDVIDEKPADINPQDNVKPTFETTITETVEVEGIEDVATTEGEENNNTLLETDDEQKEKNPEIVAENGVGYDSKLEDRTMKIKFGTNQRSNGSVLWCPNDTDKMLHTNTGIIGTMGTGKTQFTKSMITQIHRESKYNVDGKEIGILIFDYKGDYNKSKQDFIDATDAKVFELYHLPFNPLSITKSANSKPMLPLHTASTLKETLAKAFNLGPKQENLLKDLIMEAYERKGIIKNQSDTWEKTAPTFKDVYDVYMAREDIKKDDSLYAAFSNLIDFEIFEPEGDKTKGLFELIDGVTVIDLSGYDSGIQNLVVAITLDLFYSQMQAYGHSKIDGSLRQLNKMVLVDEADNFLSKNFSALKKILKEGREFGVGTILSTQLLSHFSTGENEYANYILTWVVHKVDDLSNKDVKYIFNTQSKSEEENLFNKIKNLNKHYSYVKMGDSDRPVFMKDLAFWELI